MKLIAIKSKQRDTAEALEVIDNLRAKVAAGEIVGFAVVGISADDTAYGWMSCTEHVSRLRMMGAVANLGACLHRGDLD